MSLTAVRILLILALAVAMLLLAGCDYGFTFHPEQMTPDQMLDRAELVFIGLIQEQHIDSRPFFRVPAPPGGEQYWRPLRRRVRVETVLRGADPGDEINVYEIFWLGGSTGDWNNTQDNRPYLFMVRRENGRWQVVRDWRRSIFEVNSGHHARLPLDESHPFWERYALMNYWVSAEEKGATGCFLTTWILAGRSEYGKSQRSCEVCCATRSARSGWLLAGS